MFHGRENKLGKLSIIKKKDRVGEINRIKKGGFTCKYVIILVPDFKSLSLPFKLEHDVNVCCDLV